jgi:tetratricopeptide (TPR) repeat protein
VSSQFRHGPCLLIPSFVKPLTNKCVALKNLDKYNEAIKAYDEAIRLDPNLADAWFNKGLVLNVLGRGTEAEATFAKARELGATGPVLQVLITRTSSRPFLFF